MAKEACRACDGRGSRTTEDRENVFNVTTTKCSRCNGVGIEPGPSKGKRRSFGPKKEDDEDDQNLNRAADRFLRRHGFGRGGR
jgi:DnaJ-class molecular chaperone